MKFVPQRFVSLALTFRLYPNLARRLALTGRPSGVVTLRSPDPQVMAMGGNGQRPATAHPASVVRLPDARIVRGRTRSRPNRRPAMAVALALALALPGLAWSSIPGDAPESVMAPGSNVARSDASLQGNLSLPTEGEASPYIVRLAEAPLASYRGERPGLAATSRRLTRAARLDASAPDSRAYLAFLDARQSALIQAAERTFGRALKVAFRYRGVLNGFAVHLTSEEAAQLAGQPGVLAVHRDIERELDTDVGPLHVGAPSIWNGESTNGLASRGEGVVIGVIDTGINQGHRSFAVVDGDNYVHKNPYGPGVHRGWCETNAGFCNDKLIAAYSLHPKGGSPADTHGHGSHTAGTAAGNAHTASIVLDSTSHEIPIQGVAPRANLVVYKVCDPSCPTSSAVAAIDSAVLDDEVDVINYSISGVDDPWSDLVDLAFLGAVEAGILVSASAGNTGPGAGTVAKTGPWNLSVGASTHARSISRTLDLIHPQAPASLQSLPVVAGTGTILTADLEADVAFMETNPLGCAPFPNDIFMDKLALVERGECDFAEKVTYAVNAGAIGVIVHQNVSDPPIVMGGLNGITPAVMMGQSDGLALRTFIQDYPTSARIRISAAESWVHVEAWQDVMAGFSARGPSRFNLLKPDLVAPGVSILAPIQASGPDAHRYGFMRGTSMSAPHVTGAAALLKALHPDWSPAQIKSVLVSSARDGLRNEIEGPAATPFDVGSGLLALAGAARVGLVLDETYENYLAADPAKGGDPKTLNQPSMVDSGCAISCSWTRELEAVRDGTWQVSVSAPQGMGLSVEPMTFSLLAGQRQVVKIVAEVSDLPVDEWAFASVTLTPLDPGTGEHDPLSGLQGDLVQRGSREQEPTQGSNRLLLAVQPRAAQPRIEVLPSSLRSALVAEPATEGRSEVLLIRNLGYVNLDWRMGAPQGVEGAGSLSVAGDVRVLGVSNSSCDAPSEVGWLTLDPDPKGSLSPGGAMHINVRLDATGLPLGQHRANLCLESNDPTNPLLAIPVTLTVANQVVRACREPSPPLPIPDANWGGVQDWLQIDEPLIIEDLNLYVRATHSYVADLTVRLRHMPSNIQVTPVLDPGYPASPAGCAADDIDVWVDDEGTDPPVEEQCFFPSPAIRGRAPGGEPPSNQLLAAFDGKNAQGEWRLVVSDPWMGDTGTLDAWCLELISGTMLGDANSDRRLGTEDVVAIVRHILQQDLWPQADVNRDGQVDARDVLFVIDLIRATTSTEGP